MATIFLVRHTEYSNPAGIIPCRLPLGLSTRGIQQAQRLREFFSIKNISRIYTSPVERCVQTANIISNNKLEIIKDLRLAETFSVCQGESEKPNWKEQLYDKVTELGGESPNDVKDRMIDFWENTNFESGDSYIICSHGDPLYFLYQYLRGIAIYVDNKVNEPEGYQNKGSVRIVEYVRETNLNILPIIENENLENY